VERIHKMLCVCTVFKAYTYNVILLSKETAQHPIELAVYREI